MCQIITEKMEDVERAEDWEEDLSGNEEEDLSGNDDEVKQKKLLGIKHGLQHTILFCN